MTAPPSLRCETVDVNGITLSYLEAGSPGAPSLVLLHGTFWSRVWQPVLPALAGQLHCLALDFPGFGHSEGELEVAEASVPALARIVLDTADALVLDTFAVAAHDIGGHPEGGLGVLGQDVGYMLKGRRPLRLVVTTHT